MPHLSHCVDTGPGDPATLAGDAKDWSLVTGLRQQVLMELGTALSSPSKCSDLPTIELMLEDSDMPLWDNYGARLIPRLTTSDKIFFSGSDPDKFMYSVKTDLDKGETIMRYIWDVEDVSQWLEPINISHLMNILWKQCWRGTCEGEGCDGALLVVMSVRRRARARLDLLPRCSVIRVSRVMSVTGGLVTRHHQMPAVRCKHHIRDCWQSWQGPGDGVLLRPHQCDVTVRHGDQYPQVTTGKYRVSTAWVIRRLISDLVIDSMIFLFTRQSIIIGPHHPGCHTLG